MITIYNEKLCLQCQSFIESQKKLEVIRPDEDTALKAAEGKTFVSSSLTTSARFYKEF